MDVALRPIDIQTLKAMPLDWACPMEFGGHFDSPSVSALPKLVRLGLVERKKRKNWGGSVRCQYFYRPTARGMKWLLDQ